jgi:prevent-host-death family protein
MEITVTQFKAKCLGIIDGIQKNGTEVIITRYGQPAAKLVPIDEESFPELFGRSPGMVKEHGELYTTDEEWDADS